MYESYGLFIDGRWRQASEAPFGGIREYLEAKTVKTVI
jgi:hypothetical protein